MENKTSEVVLPPQKLKSNLALWIVLGFATLASGIGIGLAMGKYFQSVSSTTSVSIVPSTPILSPTVVPVEESDPTANWKTYTGKSFSLKYPMDLDVLTENNSKIEFGNSIFKTVILSVNYINFTSLPKDSENILIDGKQAKKFQITGIGEYLALQTIEKPLIEIRYSTGLGNSKETDKLLFDQILSTFKFVDQTSGVETSNWKTYSGNGFVFKYPSGLTDLKDQGGVSGPWTGNPQSVINLGDNTTIHWGTDAPYDGFSVYTISKLASLSLLDYLHNEVEIAKNSPRGIKSDTITEISLGGQAAAFIDNEVAHREYFISSPDGKKIVVFSRINSTDGFLNTFDQVLFTFKFTN